MSTSVKLSWIGGISGLEILYWLWFKILIYKRKSVEGVPQSNESEEQKVDNIQNEPEDIKVKLQREQDKESAIFFDAIFNNIEAQDVSTVKITDIE